MKVGEKSMRVPYTPAEMFALVADVERYPEFVPGYREARVLQQDGNTLSTLQRVGFGVVTASFHSVATLDPPSHIRIRAAETPFSALRIDWTFEPFASGCRIIFRAQAALDGSLTTRLLQPWFDRLADFVPAAFAKRARVLYGQREGPGPT